MTFDIDVHVCLVSDQIAPNLLPAVDNNLGPKAKRVIMLVSTKMKAKGLAAVLKKHGIASETVEIQDAYNFNEIREKLLNILTDNEQQKLALNLTGGTKIMTIAAQSMFAMEGLPVFYMIERDNSALVMHNAGKLDPDTMMTVPLRQFATTGLSAGVWIYC